MLSIILVVLVFATLLVAVMGLGLKLLREWRAQRSQAHAAPLLSPPLMGQRVVTALDIQQRIVVTRALPPLAQRVPLPTSLSAAWYRRMRAFISLSFLLMVLLALFVQSGLADGTLNNLSRGFSLLGSPRLSATDVHAVAHVSLGEASQQLSRISQLDPVQYSSAAQFNTWAYSACSAASMTEVFDAYGRSFHISDVLQVESRIGAITPQLGLVDPSGIQSTATQFGFKTVWSNSWQLDQIINIANSGKPVIVSFPPDRYAGGHILVVTGGDASTVYLADTSLWNRRALARGQFTSWWEGFGAVVTPA